MTDKAKAVLVDDQIDYSSDIKAHAEAHLSVEIVPIESLEAFEKYMDEVEAQGEEVQFFIFDLNLQGQGGAVEEGLQALERLRTSRRFDGVPAIINSSYNHPDTTMRAYRSKANSVINKPADVKEQKKVFLKMLKYWLVLNQDAMDGS